MRLSIKETFFIIPLLLLAISSANCYASDQVELKQILEQLQKTSSRDESPEELEKRLNILKRLLKGEDIPEAERMGLEEKLKALKGQLPSEFRLSLDQVPLERDEKRYFIEGGYWLASIAGGEKQVATLYSKDTKQLVGDSQKVAPGPAGAFVLSGGYRLSHERTALIKFWHLDYSGSLSQSATSTIGVSATEGSEYYYQNIKQWGVSTYATRGVDRVDAQSSLSATNFDMLYAVTVGKGGDKDLGVALGLKYAQMDSSYKIIYSSTTSQLYNINSNVENTLIGPVFGVYGSGPIINKLRFRGLLDISVAWDHVRARRFEYDNTSTNTVLDAGRATDVAVPVIESELGVSYPLGQNLSVGLDYKAAYFSGLPVDTRSDQGGLLTDVEIRKRDILTYGLTAGVKYLF